MKLLIAEDNKEMRSFLSGMFEHEADEIIECSDGQAAVESYEKHRPDYVLMDIEMEGMDGLEAAGKILSNDPGAKIIIVTAYDHPKLRKMAELLGTIGFVPKDNLFELEKYVGRKTNGNWGGHQNGR